MLHLTELESTLDHAVRDGRLLASSKLNILSLASGSQDAVVHDSISELVSAQAWTELDDRFFKTLAFGTSGLRGRSIGKTVTRAELGTAAAGQRPEFPCVGTNALNYYNLTRAIRGLCAYLSQWHVAAGLGGRPSIVFSHDTRHFAREFVEFCARVTTESGVDALIFASHRPTPELSFAVRHTGATGGVMLTASHNPYHDNGFKVYFNEGDPIVEPVASGILKEVNAIVSDSYLPLPAESRGTIRLLGEEVDAAYLQRLEGVMLQPGLLEKARSLKIVYTAIHGTGGVFVPTILRKLGFDLHTVAAQDVPDGAFPTVKSPNPENASALKMAMDLATETGADIVIGNDPDCDRMGVAVRNASGALQLITGNEIGSLMAWYRTRTMFAMGILNEQNRDHAVIVKTLVTTPLQDVIAHAFKVKVVNTLTGFKYIGAKLTKYEKALPAAVRANYRNLTDAESCAARLQDSLFFIFGGEESYGYMCTDWIRDKDGNGAVVMFAELAAYAASRGLTIPDLLDEVYCTYGYFTDHTESPEFPGADGAEKMRRLVDSYTTSPVSSLDGTAIIKSINYAIDDVYDEEGDLLPKENMIFMDLADGRRFAMRPSGTEPKVKFYFFASRVPAPGTVLPAEQLPAIRKDVRDSIDRLWREIERDIHARLSAQS